MKAFRVLLSKRFRADGRSAISVGSEARKALSSFLEEINENQIKLSSRSACPLCGAESGVIIAEKDRLGLPRRTMVCKRCDLVFNDSYLDESSSVSFYENHWRAIQWGEDAQKNFELRARPDSYSWKRLAFVGLHLGERLRETRVIMEPGCGDGCNLLPYHLLGKEVLGSDYDAACLEAGRRTGMRLLQGGTEELLKCEEKADLILLSHVVEHFIDVDGELEKIAGLLGEGGYVYVEVPGIRNLNRARSQVLSEDGFRSTNDFLGYIQFQHNFDFELSTLKSFFERNGFRFIAGDEWVRALFIYTGRASVVAGEDEYRARPNITDHLRAVEKDYLSLKNRVLVAGKAALPRIGKLLPF